MSKPPDYLVQRNRTTAVHWLVPKIVETALFGKTEMNSIACGYGLAASAWTGRATTQKHLITCKACWPIAHPPKNPYQINP